MGLVLIFPDGIVGTIKNKYLERKAGNTSPETQPELTPKIGIEG
jgi:hypothetical protein